ncbi:elongation factor EF-Ts [Candidatus Hodgkinia cicadicola]|uniref:Elongation factor EF-Ts n=1 Tax=Candidatus Hodgkinia cicadicola TaxID=573658 RepID=A0ABX4MJG0_9HYPH|nr:elongation factor EF-Ts [Candidatus Hodgkinia cicadicola]PIM96170.1 elongation factor EF-Ts [Candidatus Hodgkinia cicadicola]
MAVDSQPPSQPDLEPTCPSYTPTPNLHQPKQPKPKNHPQQHDNNLPLNPQTVSKPEVITDIIFHPCIELKYDTTTFGPYLHERPNNSTYKGLTLTPTSLTPTQRSLISLTRSLCRLSYFRTSISFQNQHPLERYHRNLQNQLHQNLTQINPNLQQNQQLHSNLQRTLHHQVNINPNPPSHTS